MPILSSNSGALILLGNSATFMPKLSYENILMAAIGGFKDTPLTTISFPAFEQQMNTRKNLN
jgi:hypothetical protein